MSLKNTYIAACILTFLLLPALSQAAPPAVPPGILRTDRLQKFIDRVGLRPDLQQEGTTIIIEGDLDAGARSLIGANQGKIRYQFGNRHELFIPAGRLGHVLDRLPAQAQARFPYPHSTTEVISQGVALTGAADMQGVGITGAGVKVGIIDLGFTSYTTSQANGELPANLIITDYTGYGTGGTNHGTNVAEIVHDMAPGATLYLARIGTSLQLQAAVNDMIAAGVKVINHSVGWVGAGFFDGTGSICEIADLAESSGVQWINSMGNYRNKHYLGTFTDTDGDLCHEFAPGQNYNTVSLTAGSQFSLMASWDDYPSSRVDYNLYLYDGDPAAGGSLVDSSESVQFRSAPYEQIVYTPTVSGTYYFVVRKTSSNTSHLPLSVFSFEKDFSIKTTASSIIQPADGFAVLGIGATRILTDAAEWFSSEGPTIDGRNKPEISGPDGGQTSLSGAFYGTSASAPHVAGAAALLLAQNPALTTAELRALLIADAHDVSTGGFDFRTGYGRISLDADGDDWNHDDDNCPMTANPSQIDTDLDSAGDACDQDDDNDGLTDALELAIATNPLLADTDRDGLSDYEEVAYDGDPTAYTPGLDLDPLNQDTDGDMLSDALELTIGSSPLFTDTDGDSLGDYTEVAYDGNPASYTPGVDLDPSNPDTDGDGVNDASDPMPLDYHYLDGDLAPLGAPDGIINVADLVIARRILLGEIIPSELELAHGDLYPAGAPDGVFNLSDFIPLLHLTQ